MRPASSPAGLPAGVTSFPGGVEQLLEETWRKTPHATRRLMHNRWRRSRTHLAQA
jgi:hypothetical protein